MCCLEHWPVMLRFNITYDRSNSIQDVSALDIKIREAILQWDSSSMHSSEPIKPFGGVYFEAVDMDKQAIQMTMQYSVPPLSVWDVDDVLGSGIRQMVNMTQMTSALVKIKNACKYVNSQGPRDLPYEFDPNWLNGRNLSPWRIPICDLSQTSKSERDPESKFRASTHTTENDLLEGADADVYAERERVQTVYDPENTPLIIDNLFHRYRGKVEPALRGMSFGVETNTVLGLLGPNGAGKSTMIHLLTGLYSRTSGIAHVAGAEIRTNMAMVHAKIGVCPQHDILWGDLTVADHLLFYSRLRGIPPSLEQQAVTFAIASVSLTKFRNRQIKGLSG
ncbi:hypothetical protein BGZ59_002875, partial [Podila verticillata]